MRRLPDNDLAKASPGFRRRGGCRRLPLVAHEETRRTRMAKEELLEFDGVVTEVLPDGKYRVRLDNDHQILAYNAGKMRRFRIRTGVGDKVIVEMSPYDLERGPIRVRHKSDRAAVSPSHGS